VSWLFTLFLSDKGKLVVITRRGSDPGPKA
jgi:hypothetical protein